MWSAEELPAEPRAETIGTIVPLGSDNRPGSDPLTGSCSVSGVMGGQQRLRLGGDGLGVTVQNPPPQRGAAGGGQAGQPVVGRLGVKLVPMLVGDDLEAVV